MWKSLRFYSSKTNGNNHLKDLIKRIEENVSKKNRRIDDKDSSIRKRGLSNELMKELTDSTPSPNKQAIASSMLKELNEVLDEQTKKKEKIDEKKNMMRKPEQLDTSLSDHLKSLEVESTEPSTSSSFTPKSEFSRTYKLFDDERLKVKDKQIFDKKLFQSKPSNLSKTIFEQLFDLGEDLRRKEILQKIPSNQFEELIQLTERGSIWSYPIDNEERWNFDKNSSFEEHIFLENDSSTQLDDEQNHFLHLVQVGLSSNPYLSVAEKKEHIDFYVKYFEEKNCELNKK
ncbi:hypothetical protein SNEBB_008111 [Seison nebaliae]|nr:hypothetical protein SNEBB_008111 [Seison nebaliae]